MIEFKSGSIKFNKKYENEVKWEFLKNITKENGKCIKKR